MPVAICILWRAPLAFDEPMDDQDPHLGLYPLPFFRAKELPRRSLDLNDPMKTIPSHHLCLETGPTPARHRSLGIRCHALLGIIAMALLLALSSNPAEATTQPDTDGGATPDFGTDSVVLSFVGGNQPMDSKMCFESRLAAVPPIHHSNLLHFSFSRRSSQQGSAIEAVAANHPLK